MNDENEKTTLIQLTPEQIEAMNTAIEKWRVDLFKEFAIPPMFTTIEYDTKWQGDDNAD